MQLSMSTVKRHDFLLSTPLAFGNPINRIHPFHVIKLNQPSSNTSRYGTFEGTFEGTERFRMLGSSSQPRKRLGSENYRLSLKLSYVLRHGAARLQLPMNGAGFVPVSSLRANVEGLESLTDEKVRELADKDRKNRFGLWSDDDNNLRIRANQGHSEEVAALIDSHELLEPLSISDIPDLCVHGTTLSAWTQIQRNGLSKMNRHMIHFATGLPQDRNVVSGMRATSEVLIFVHVAAAIKDGIPFYRSENSVLLSPGIADTGLLPVKYFKKVVRSNTGEILEPNLDVQ